MNAKVDEAITKLAEMTATKMNSLEAMQFAQATLNMANAKATLEFAETDLEVATAVPKRRGRPPKDKTLEDRASA